MGEDQPGVNPSPHPPMPDDKEPTTGEFLVAQVENLVRDQTKQVESNVRTGVSQRLTIQSAFQLLTLLAALAMGVWKANDYLVNEAKAQADASVSQVKREADTTEAALKSHRDDSDARFRRLERQGDRTEEKIDAMLRAFNVPNPAPKPPDGGSP